MARTKPRMGGQVMRLIALKLDVAMAMIAIILALDIIVLPALVAVWSAS